MHSILLAIRADAQRSDNEKTTDKWWKAVHQSEERAKQSPTVQQLGLGCWLIPLDTGLPFLGYSIAALETSSLAYSLLYIEDPPQLQRQPAPTGT